MRMPPLARAAVALSACFLWSACDTARPMRASLGGGAQQLGADGYGADWVGVYKGAGRGVIGSMNVDLAGATLSIQLDHDSVRYDGCSRCVTITLDTLFWLPNVFLSDPQSARVRYVEDDIRHVLALDLFSGGGGTANVVQAALRVEATGGGPTLADVTYVLER